MSEIEKMYENAGVTCLHPLGFCKHIGATCEVCERHKYPPFTAEKQLKLFKLLIRHPKTEVYCRYANDKYKLIMYTEDCCTSDIGSFENVLASVVCNIWGLLTEEEKQQVKGILE